MPARPTRSIDLLGPRGAVGLALAADLQAVGDVVDHPAVRQQPEVLEHHGELAPAQLPQPLVVGRAHVLALEEDLARGRLDQPRQAADQRGLARTGQAHDDEDLAGRDVEGDVADGGGASGPVLQLGAGEPASSRTPATRSACGPNTFHSPRTSRTAGRRSSGPAVAARHLGR